MSDSATEPAKLRDMPQPGDLVTESYRLEHIIGSGGMGAVYAAVRIDDDQRVALKVMLQSEGEPHSTKRFEREARAIGAIDNPHVAKLLDFGELDDGSPFMVMELLEGETLDEVIKDRAPLPIEESVECLLQACEGVAEAHACGIVHRDLKPSNLYWSRVKEGVFQVKVLDFGISKAPLGLDSQTASTSLTESNTLLGSPQYMSPEQVRNPRGVDERADIWALGLILFKLLTGRAAFEANNVGEHFGMIMSDPPTKLRARRPEAPEQLEQVVLCCLCKDVAGRYQDVGQLASALAPFGADGSDERVARICALLEHAGRASSERPSLPQTGLGDSHVDDDSAAETLDKPLTPLLPTADTAVSDALPSSKPAGRRGRQVAIGAALAIAAVATWTLSQRSKQPPRVEPSPGVAATEASSTPSPATADSVTIELRIAPQQAVAQLDGTAVDWHRPLQLARSEQSRRLVVTAGGYQPWTRNFAPSNNVVFDIALVPTIESAASAAPAEPSASAPTRRRPPPAPSVVAPQAPPSASSAPAPLPPPPPPSASAPELDIVGPMVDHL